MTVHDLFNIAECLESAIVADKWDEAVIHVARLKTLTKAVDKYVGEMVRAELQNRGLA
jgi:hypothetical protein